MGKPNNCTVDLQKKRQMRNNRKNRRRQQRAIIKHAVASKAAEDKLAERIREQMLIAKIYCAKWRKICKETKFRRSQHIKQVIEPIIAHLLPCLWHVIYNWV